MFAEMKQLGTLLLDQTQKKSWIERNLACQEISLLIQVIDSKELGIQPGQAQSKPANTGKWDQTKTLMEQQKKSKVFFEEREKKKDSDILSSDEDFTSVKVGN
jgi:hypothetical protein